MSHLFLKVNVQPGRLKKEWKINAPLQSHLSTSVQLGDMERVHMIQILDNEGMITEAVQ